MGNMIYINPEKALDYYNKLGIIENGLETIAQKISKVRTKKYLKNITGYTNVVDDVLAAYQRISSNGYISQLRSYFLRIYRDSIKIEQRLGSTSPFKYTGTGESVVAEFMDKSYTIDGYTLEQLAEMDEEELAAWLDLFDTAGDYSKNITKIIKDTTEIYRDSKKAGTSDYVEASELYNAMVLIACGVGVFADVADITVDMDKLSEAYGVAARSSEVLGLSSDVVSLSKDFYKLIEEVNVNGGELPDDIKNELDALGYSADFIDLMGDAISLYDAITSGEDCQEEWEDWYSAFGTLAISVVDIPTGGSYLANIVVSITASLAAYAQTYDGKWDIQAVSEMMMQACASAYSAATFNLISDEDWYTYFTASGNIAGEYYWSNRISNEDGTTLEKIATKIYNFDLLSYSLCLGLVEGAGETYRINTAAEKSRKEAIEDAFSDENIDELLASVGLLKDDVTTETLEIVKLIAFENEDMDAGDAIELCAETLANSSSEKDCQVMLAIQLAKLELGVNVAAW